MSLANATGGTSVTDFPDIEIGKEYELVFEPGILFQYIPDVTYPKTATLGAYTVTFKHAKVNYVTKTYAVIVQVDPVDPRLPHEATVPTYLIVGALAIVIGVITIFMLKEVRLVLPEVPNAVNALISPLVILAVIIGIVYFIIKT